MTGKKIAVIMVLVCMLAGLPALAGCGGSSGTNAGEKPKKGKSINISMTIEYPEKARLAGLENITFPVEENTTVLQAIELFCNISDIPCYLETTSNTIVGINTVMNGDFNKKRIWMFSVNDGPLRTDATEVRLKNGDSLKWTYGKVHSQDEESADADADANAEGAEAEADTPDDSE